MGRNPCCAKEGLNKGAWTAIEDQILKDYIKIHGEGKWRDLPKRAGLKRCGKSCRLRWLNYLRPDIKRGNITRDEEDLIIRLHNLLGNRWSLIAGRLPGRTDNEIKNYWNTNIGKKIQNGNFKSSTTSSGARSSSSSAGQDPNHETPPDMGPCVVYTQATRCTDIIVTKDRAQQLEPLMVAAPSVTPESETLSPSLSLPHLRYEEDNNNPLSNFMEGFEMDESFFSDLLTMDIAEPSCFENRVEDSNASPTEVGYNNLLLSPKSEDAAHLLSDDNSLHGSEDFKSMFALMESELDWL